MEKYIYLIWSSLYFVLWLIFFIYRKDLRKHIIWSSVIAIPAALVEILWVHKYWAPPSIFNLINTYGVGFEDFLYSFSIGGVAAVLYELLEKKKDVASKKKHFHTAFFVFFLVFILLTFFFPLKPALNMSYAFTFGSLVMIYQRNDLLAKTLFSGFVFSVISILFIFIVIRTLSPEYIKNFYVHSNLLGFSALGIPIEEFIFAFTGGAFWSIVYEYLKGYKLK